jgi:hypothetical protein
VPDTTDVAMDRRRTRRLETTTQRNPVTETPEGSRHNALAAVPVRPAVGRLSSTLDGGTSCCGRRCTLASNGVGVRVGR